ncbi:FAD-binding oxidoreductase [Rhodobacteraceae bacterium HSP-20]|uniref:FAD-binding oxidoreductase n=1 Tax=Paragemmobacter amnigenus TaxID=2852097 RepID=A0ABS6J3N1_9RHOB|nr:FAD-binding oxidoreductase [Rhodobacter amnigenus]MBU9698122.1 FAD-binding oxidoreductase [Rhodobacter amnigenus]MBV4389349.1 FAD-binding oxidoreductase [Rhodobacter amnigenus]
MSDFLVIGGGIGGISAAARLSELGSVTVLEAEGALAHHASGRSAALYEPRYGAPAVVELSLASEAHFRATENILSPRGLMSVAKADQRAEFDAEVRDFQLEVVSVDEARAVVPVLNPDVVAFAAVADHAWDIDTDLLLQGFAREAKGRGAQIVTGARVTAIARGGEGWVVQSAAGEFTGRVLVNAAGAWVDQVAVMAGVRPLGFTPNRRSMARIPAPGGLDISRWPMIFGAGEAWYAKPDAGALIVSPAEEHPQEPHDAWADDMVLAEGLARYEEMVTEPVTRLISNWAGLRTFAPDRVLVIGRDAREADFFWLAGQGGYGFQTCPAASLLAADLIGGRATDLSDGLVAALDPARFG